jgi:transcriptional regulator with XRE-family HTH domain
MILRDTAAGKKMAELRAAKGLSMRDVFEMSREIGRVHRNRSFLVAPSRLSDIEARGMIPDAPRLYVLSLIYDCTVSS